MELLLKKSTSGMNTVNKAGRTSLHVAVCKQHPDCVRVLLKYRCDVNVQVYYLFHSFTEYIQGGPKKIGTHFSVLLNFTKY